MYILVVQLFLIVYFSMIYKTSCNIRTNTVINKAILVGNTKACVYAVCVLLLIYIVVQVRWKI